MREIASRYIGLRGRLDNRLDFNVQPHHSSARSQTSSSDKTCWETHCPRIKQSTSTGNSAHIRGCLESYTDSLTFETHLVQGLAPEIIPSAFKEDLPIDSFDNIHEYPVATATHKAVEVYERLVVRCCVSNLGVYIDGSLLLWLVDQRSGQSAGSRNSR